eukprot:CAMPEP_0181134996 /NCGR_PEP_ID=MMETSP1071-20121207/32386_1 /TAXON_ID=35127 /ORGANISM="Thalassiosira sp., Strain NH16" /LENGTH=364 /DNA_ID=CAMNT_0023221553 /DNA_START=42 /DNA_END=1136 /DNA_ORIENTATION=+
MSESVASEVVSAMVGGMFSASALYPLEVLKTRMQAETKGSAKKEEEEADDAEDGRILPNAQEGKNDNDDAAKTARSNAAASAAEDRAESASNTAMSAEEKAKSSKLALKSRYSAAASEGMGSYASLMYSNEGGVAPFYAGVVTSAVQSATEKALYFFAYTFLKNEYVGITGNPNIGAISNLILGCFAEWAHLPVTLPIDCVTTAIQTDDKNRGAFVLLGSILSEKGIGGFYKGIEAYTVLCLKPAIQYTVYEQVKKIVIASRRINAQGGRVVSESLHAAEAFFLGMFARIVATMLTYPYLRAKVMLQSTYKNAVVKPSIPGMIAEQFCLGIVSGDRAGAHEGSVQRGAHDDGEGEDRGDREGDD